MTVAALYPDGCGGRLGRDGLPTGRCPRRQDPCGSYSMPVPARHLGEDSMADYTPAHLKIGGEITNEQYRAIQRLTPSGAGAVWWESYDLWDNEARGGAFPELEDYLTAANIAFDRHSEP